MHSQYLSQQQQHQHLQKKNTNKIYIFYLRLNSGFSCCCYAGIFLAICVNKTCYEKKRVVVMEKKSEKENKIT